MTMITDSKSEDNFDYYEEVGQPIGSKHQGEYCNKLENIGMKIRNTRLIKLYKITIEVEYYEKKKVN
jgi:hypothetical protein